MLGTLRKLVMTPLLLLLSACGLVRCTPEPLGSETIARLYQAPVQSARGPLSVYHLGHSLVGRDMPAMLAQLAGEEHRYESQLGWGTSLMNHWTGTINGFETENSHPRYRDAGEAFDSGTYDAVVLTEMVEIRDAVKYHESWDYLNRWASRARDGRTDIRIYLYETWHNTDDPAGWLERIDTDLGQYWEREILDRAMAAHNPPQPIYVIPAGQVFARFVSALEERGGVDGLTGAEDLFALNEKGERDTIHFNDIGAYLVALTHYTVLYHKSPAGLPHVLLKADGTPAVSPGAEAARLMQEIVWDVVTRYPRTGVPQAE